MIFLLFANILLRVDPLDSPVVDHFELSRELVTIAMSHLDRYLSNCPDAIGKSQFQLLSLTCLYLSIKLNVTAIIKTPGSKSTMDTLRQLSRGFFTLDDMERMECDMLQRLQWHVHPPTPQRFVRTILRLIAAEEDGRVQAIHNLANFMAELAAMDYFFTPYKSSEIGMAAILNSLDELNPTQRHRNEEVFSRVCQDFGITGVGNIKACRERMAIIYAENVIENGEHEDDILDPSSLQEGVEIRTTSPVCVTLIPAAE